MKARAAAPLAPDHLRFAVLAADIALFTVRDGRLLVRLSAVNRLPHYEKASAIPGGLLRAEETAEEAAARLLLDRGGIDPAHAYMEQLYTFSKVERDPRGRVVAVGYLALVPWESLKEKERDARGGAYWSPVEDARKLAYDHDEVLASAVARLKSRVSYTTLIGKLMPGEFTLTELEAAYGAILKKDLDKRNFRKKILKLGVLAPVEGKKRTGAFRPAQLYRFKKRAVTEIPVL